MANQLTLLPAEIIEWTPSRKDGVERDIEVNLRVYGCELIQKAGIMLRLQAVTIASGQTLLHRFYFRRSLKCFEIRRLAAAALYLACKLEEDPRRVRDVVNVFHYFEKQESSSSSQDETADVLDVNSEEYKEFRHDIIRFERYILRELGFMASQTLVHPHRYILQYIHSLFKGTSAADVRLLSQLAWGYLNDSMRTTLCCEVQPAVIAVGSIYLAACDLQISLPQETCWYELFDVTWQDVVKVCTTIRSLYLRPPCTYIMLSPKDAAATTTVKDTNDTNESKVTDVMESTVSSLGACERQQALNATESEREAAEELAVVLSSSLNEEQSSQPIEVVEASNSITLNDDVKSDVAFQGAPTAAVKVAAATADPPASAVADLKSPALLVPIIWNESDVADTSVQKSANDAELRGLKSSKFFSKGVRRADKDGNERNRFHRRESTSSHYCKVEWSHRSRSRENENAVSSKSAYTDSFRRHEVRYYDRVKHSSSGYTSHFYARSSHRSNSNRNLYSTRYKSPFRGSNDHGSNNESTTSTSSRYALSNRSATQS